MKICSFITLYKPDLLKLEKNINEISKYAERIYLLDNTPLKDNICIPVYQKCVVIKNNKNIGLSSAFNIALNVARNEGFEYTILFDQDSYLRKESFDILEAEYLKYSKDYNLMCVGPSLNIYGNAVITPNWSLNKLPHDVEGIDSVLNIITSGMFLNINKALAIGGFNEDYPVDFCDFFFCWKAIYNGYIVLKSRNAFLYHEIGNSQMKIGKSTIHFHSPYRNYFLVRDTLNICFKEKETPFYIRLRYFIFLLPRMVLFILRCDKKKERIKMYLLGLKDFIKNQRGYGSIAELLGAK